MSFRPPQFLSRLPLVLRFHWADGIVDEVPMPGDLAIPHFNPDHRRLRERGAEFNV